MANKKYKQLKNPPIKEAVIQIRVSPNKNLDISSLEAIAKKEDKRYTDISAQKTTIFELISSEEGHKTGVSDRGVNGYKIKDPNKRQIAQLFPDRLAVSKLDPYKSWVDLEKETKRLWEIYKEIAKPEKITGISVRYINHFDLPENMKNFEDYLVSCPNLPDDLPQAFASFYTNVRLPNSDIGAVASIQTIFEGVKKDDEIEKNIRIPIILDIDAYKKISIPIDSDELWEEFMNLHDYKNAIFFSSLTNKCLGLFK